MPEHPIVHVDIPGEDPEATGRFYADLFGWQVQALPAMRYTRFESPNGVTGGFVEPGGPLQHQVRELLVYVGSEDIDADLARAETLGGKVLVAETQIPNTGSFAIIEDPAGNRIGLFHRTGFVRG